MSVNDEPENLMVLPPIDDSIEDKLIILRASKSPMPMPTATLEQRKAFWETLEERTAGVPAFSDPVANPPANSQVSDSALPIFITPKSSRR